MKKNSLAVAFVLLLSFATTVYAGDFIKVSGYSERWKTADYVLEGTWEALHVLDWGTTQDIRNHPNLYETNIAMGKHPSRQTVNLYMGGWAILHPVITDLLPKKVTIAEEYEIPVRTIFQGISIGVTGGAVAKNFSLGLHVNF